MTAKTDRELLELAAKAAENDAYWNTSAKIFMVPNGEESWHKPWNPLTDDGDALRLATKLMMEIRVLKRTAHAEALNGPGPCSEESDDIFSAVRRAIVRAAAAMGETL